MGWLWTSQSTYVDASTPQNHLPTSSPQKDHPLSPEPKRAPTRDELAESELRSFLKELEADERPSSTKHSGVPRSPPPPPAHKPWNLTLEEELLPTEMSCRQAFDSAFYCQSLGGQFNNLYRYGGIKSCSEHWGDFWFCMRTKAYPADQKQVMIRAHYKKKILKYKLGRSSEDVWESRIKKLEWGEAFSNPVEVYVGNDEEWNRRERIRREAKAEGTT